MTENESRAGLTCEVCGAMGVPLRCVPIQEPRPGAGYVWTTFTSCFDCNPVDGGVGDEREHGDRAGAWGRAGGAA